MFRQIEETRHQSELGRWESAVALPHPALRGLVREYYGGCEYTYQPLVRRELPTDVAPVIINFGAPFRIFDQTDPAMYTEFRSFATGAFDTYVLVGSTGSYSCIQINFTILGARLFLQQPLRALTNQEVALDDVLGRAARDLECELFDAPTWAERFDIIDRVILQRLCSDRVSVPVAVSAAWNRLLRSSGQLSIGALVHEAGWSHKHFITQFTEHFGLTPKAMARVLRFGRAAELLKVSARGRLSEIALDCGYYDQAHFTRDFRTFAGVTPMELLASQLPEGGGFIG